MKHFLVFCFLLAYSSAQFPPSESVGRSSPNSSRSYYPEENDPVKVKYLITEDEKGQVYFEDLTQPIPDIKVTEADLKFYLYTVKDQLKGSAPLQVSDLNDLKKAKSFNPKKENYFIVHGFHGNYKSNVNIVLRRAILNVTDANVFVADWNRHAKKIYLSAFISIPKIGEYMGNFINQMIDHYGLTPKRFRLIGHSLGAHVAGCAGTQVNGLVDYIVGLDPAGPLFTLGNTANRLDENDADFVHIIHTNDGVLGFASSIGDADYFPNGGSKQPGCRLDFIGTCAHRRAFYYYAESILTGGFTAKKCENYKSYKSGKCDNNESSYLGNLSLDKSASGNYYLKTKGKQPFSLT